MINSMNAARFPRILRTFVSALAILLAGSVHSPAGVIVGTSLDLTGSIYTGPLSTIQFVPVGSPQAVAGNVFWNDTVYSPIATNGAFAAQLQQGFYYCSPVNHSVFGPAIRKVLIYDPDSSTNTYAFSVCANLALVLSGYLQTNLPPSGDGSGLTGLEVGNFATNNSVAAPTPMQFIQWNGSAFQFGTASGGGGSATNAYLSEPHGLAADAAGNLFISHPANARIRKVATNGIITASTPALISTGPSIAAGTSCGPSKYSESAVISGLQGIPYDRGSTTPCPKYANQQSVM